MGDKVFGEAKDFYRVRVVTLDEEIPMDFEWRENILFIPQVNFDGETKREYLLQVVTLDSSSKIVFAQAFKSKREAGRHLKKIQEDLTELTKMEFEKKYNLSSTVQ